MQVIAVGPDGAEVNPFTRQIRYKAINHPLPEVLRDELRRLGTECGKCRKRIDDARGDKLRDVESEYRSWQKKLNDLLAKLRAEYSTAIERQFIGRWVPE